MAPKQVDLKTIQDMDQDDESLVKYKQQLLGQTQGVLGKWLLLIAYLQCMVFADAVAIEHNEPFFGSEINGTHGENSCSMHFSYNTVIIYMYTY